MTAPTTVPLADLEARVPDGVGIDVPGPEGGWAVAVIAGREYRARVAPVERAEEEAWDEGWAARAEYDTRRDVPLDWPDRNPYRATERAEES